MRETPKKNLSPEKQFIVESPEKRTSRIEAQKAFLNSLFSGRQSKLHSFLHSECQSLGQEKSLSDCECLTAKNIKSRGIEAMSQVQRVTGENNWFSLEDQISLFNSAKKRASELSDEELIHRKNMMERARQKIGLEIQAYISLFDERLVKANTESRERLREQDKKYKVVENIEAKETKKKTRNKKKLTMEDLESGLKAFGIDMDKLNKILEKI